ncbi:MAG TPA: hypothetical protein VLX56_01185 [Nitrososphaerales archaeon]|nr:hypothetical protein [Nitrososphaerales archaeon]
MNRIAVILVPLLLIVGASFTQAEAHSAVQMYATSQENQSIITEAYSIVVPPLPSVCCQAAYEIHAGIGSADNQTLMKTTISYGCQIAQHKPCMSPYLDRYVFYLSIINQTSSDRTQVPGGGWVLTPGSNYAVILTQGKPCTAQTYPAWVVKATNGSSSFSTTVCGSSPLLQGRTFNAAVSGTLEVHNLTSCSQLPPSDGATQSSMTLLNSAGQPLPLSWAPKVNPGQPTCGDNLAFTNNSKNVNLIWGSNP